MNRNEKKAREYLAREKNAAFRTDLEEVLARGDDAELNDRFFRELEFGTGGLRGIIGGGLNRMNPYIVRRATQGLANYIRKQAAGPQRVVIAYDSRRYSDLFAEEAALVLCAAGLETCLFSSLRPTPELSFAVRRLHAAAGIVITASHNPARYNGYKVYWNDGGQIVPPHDRGIIEEVRKVGDEIGEISRSEAEGKGLLRIIDEEIDTPFVDMIRGLCLRRDCIAKYGRDVQIVYTPLHGSGRMLVERVMTELGISVFTVPEQAVPDGNFPTVEYPNPEIGSAMELALKYARERKADLVMGTDPDSDRLGIGVPDGNDYVLITGNQLGALLCHYRFSTLEEMERLPPNPAFIKTIVTTELQSLIARKFGAKVYDVLTGFKYIAEKIRRFENTGENYVFGGEESYGYLVETETRDKNAVSAAVLTAEMVTYLKSQGKGVIDRLEELYKEFGYFEEFLISHDYEGEEGIGRIAAIMDGLRKRPPQEIGGIRISEIRDFKEGRTTAVSRGESYAIDLPRSNVLQYVLADGSIVSARPSGTEPKIKFYCSCRDLPGTVPSVARARTQAKIAGIRSDINSWCEY